MKKCERDVIVSSRRGKTAELVWKHNEEVLCSIGPETAKGLAYDLLDWAKKAENKYKRKK